MRGNPTVLVLKDSWIAEPALRIPEGVAPLLAVTRGKMNVLGGYRDSSDDCFWGRPVTADAARFARRLHVAVCAC